jgi:hypothetical protein
MQNGLEGNVSLAVKYSNGQNLESKQAPLKEK